MNLNDIVYHETIHSFWNSQLRSIPWLFLLNCGFCNSCNVLSYLRHFCWSCVSANLLTECGQTKFRYLAFYSFCTAEVIDCPYKWSRETGTALYYNRGSLGNLHILYLMVSCSRSWITITILFKTNENSVTIHWLLKSIFAKHNRGISVYDAGLHVCVHL